MSYPNSQYSPGQSGYSPNQPTGGSNQAAMALAIFSVIIGGMGIFSACSCVGCFLIWMPPLAVLLGGIALALKPDQTARTLAIVGMGLGALDVMIWILMFGLHLLPLALPQPPRPVRP